MPIVIGISGISGAGTTTIAVALEKVFKATVVFWDDFDEISQGPDDYVKWFHESGNYADWHYPALEKTLQELRGGRSIYHPVLNHLLVATPIIIFDGSMGRKHESTARLVDFFIHLDTSMDVALARRLLRDYGKNKIKPVSEIMDDLQWYLEEGRPLFGADEIKSAADFVVVGDGEVDEIVKIILAEIKQRRIVDTL